MLPFFSLLIFALIIPLSLNGKPVPVAREFQIVERSSHAESGETMFYLRTLEGIERTNNSLNRLSILSENQRNYPTPESGCGPTAILNILVWYQKFGLIEPFSRESNLTDYKLKLFNEIDHRLTQQAGVARTDASGVNNMDAATVMDSIVQECSDGAVRIHTEFIKAPLKLKDLLDSMLHFRSGFLIVTPQSRTTGKMLNDHAVTLVRADRAGYVTLATWGQHYHGLLKARNGEQWFIPQDPTHMELKVVGLTRFTPFRPTTPVNH